jgi:hypothetical protein
MIWVTWRQHRMQLLFGMGVVALLLAFLLPTGFGIWSTFRSTGLANCLSTVGRDCGDVGDLFSNRYNGYAFIAPLFLVLPALLGAFWGAPLVAREVEQGTYRLAWTQSVTRARWTWTKIVVLGVATVLASAVLAWVLSWWSRPLVAPSNNRFNLGIFDLRGIVPVAYALFAVAVGIAAGTVIRRVVPSMGATLGAYLAVRLPVEFWLRPHFAAAKTYSYPFFARDPRAGLGDWVLSTKTVDASGHFLANGQQLNSAFLSRYCPSLSFPGTGGALPVPGPGVAAPKGAGGFDPLMACARKIGIRISVAYQPGSRYWLFQGIETAIFVALALGLIAFSVWFVRRRLT